MVWGGKEREEKKKRIPAPSRPPEFRGVPSARRDRERDLCLFEKVGGEDGCVSPRKAAQNSWKASSVLQLAHGGGVHIDFSPGGVGTAGRCGH